MRRALLVLVVASASSAGAQPSTSDTPQAVPSQPPAVRPSSDPSAVLREANAAATVGDWARVSAFTSPLLSQKLDRPDLAEAHRLAGLAAFFQHREPEAEADFLEYLRFDLDGRLDPALYPPEVVGFFDDVRAKHAADLRALRPKPRRYWLLNLVPPFGQFQNGDRAKGFITGGLIGAFAITNVTSYLVLRSWCTQAVGSAGPSLVCDQHGGAKAVRTLEIVGGIGLILTYVWGVYDGVSNYRRGSRAPMAPYATASNNGALVGVVGRF
ncbi:MAG: hypothetical protein JWO36_2087 [Myxococcales bacterium]|nr:hypothetical protein [Myxococcales bacterium]